jgi:hypothetical protein
MHMILEQKTENFFWRRQKTKKLRNLTRYSNTGVSFFITTQPAHPYIFPTFLGVGTSLSRAKFVSPCQLPYRRWRCMVLRTIPTLAVTNWFEMRHSAKHAFVSSANKTRHQLGKLFGRPSRVKTQEPSKKPQPHTTWCRGCWRLSFR